jgi:hypothetical protein
MVLGVPMGYYIIKVVSETDEKIAGESEAGPPI